jgi:hypothetical protein
MSPDGYRRVLGFAAGAIATASARDAAAINKLLGRFMIVCSPRGFGIPARPAAASLRRRLSPG